MNEEKNVIPAEDLSVFEMKPKYSMINALNVIQSPTNPAWIKTRRSGRDDLSYVSGDTVTRMLNKAFKYQWSFHVLETRVIDSIDKAPTKWEKDKNPNAEATPQNPVVQVLGRLVVPALGVREQWGSQPLLGGADVQEHAFKSAATDAMKKCASMFGIALDLYGQDGMDELMVGPEDFLFDDDSFLGHIKAQRAGKERKKTTEEPAQKPVQETPQPAPQEPTQQATEQPAQQPVQQKQPVEPAQQDFGSQLAELGEQQAPQQTPTVEPAPVQQAPVEEPQIVEQTKSQPRWEKEDIDGLKAEKARLGLATNEGLNSYTAQFFGSDTATYQMITPTNVKDFLMFLSTHQPN